MPFPFGELIFQYRKIENNNFLFLGVSLQQGFSVKNRVNLLAAGYTDSFEGYGGSGIYLREGKSKVVLSSESLLQEDVPINQNLSHDITVSIYILISSQLNIESNFC